MSSYPVHEHLTICTGEDIYKTGNWWKAVVQYQVNDSNTETAVYLWHKDDGSWTRKNKYVIKTPSAWEDDREVISDLLTIGEQSSEMAPPDPLPVSDYYSVSHGMTIFKTEQWWKSIVRVDAKGDYETTEVVVYLWQQTDGNWKRRQKYTIKDLDDWEEEKELISRFVADGAESVSTDNQAKSDSEELDGSNSVRKELEGKIALAKQKEHLSDQIKT